MKDQIRRWFDYEKHANQITLNMLRSVPADRRREAAYQKAIDKFAHTINARKLWLFRFGINSLPPSTIFPQDVELPQLQEMIDDVYSKWDRYMADLDDAEINRSFEYEAQEGGRFANSVVDILVQLHGHAIYHRGQVAMLVNDCGGEVEDTDFVYWSRETLD